MHNPIGCDDSGLSAVELPERGVRSGGRFNSGWRGLGGMPDGSEPAKKAFNEFGDRHDKVIALVFRWGQLRLCRVF